MNIKFFLDMCEDFFEQIYPPPFIENKDNEIIRENSSDDESDDEDMCECNLCYLVKQILLYIN